MFLEAVHGARPLDGRHRDRVVVPPPPPSPAKMFVLPPTSALTVDGDSHRYAARNAGVSHAQVAQLRAGKIHVEETLDLHGETVARASERLREFLVVASRMRRCVLVIHGKGTHSEFGAPLREAVLEQLLGPLSGLVHAFSTAAPADGGAGATYIMLRGAR